MLLRLYAADVSVALFSFNPPHSVYSWKIAFWNWQSIKQWTVLCAWMCEWRACC